MWDLPELPQQRHSLVEHKMHHSCCSTSLIYKDQNVQLRNKRFRSVHTSPLEAGVSSALAPTTITYSSEHTHIQQEIAVLNLVSQGIEGYVCLHARWVCIDSFSIQWPAWSTHACPPVVHQHITCIWLSLSTAWWQLQTLTSSPLLAELLRLHTCARSL